MTKKIKIRKSTVFMISYFAILTILNIISWNSIKFSDWHRKNVFPKIQAVFSRITGSLPFSVGEIMILLIIIFVIFGGISYIILMLILKEKRKKISYIFGRTALWIILFFFSVETTNFFMLYHCSSFAQNYGISESKHTSEELYKVAVYISEKANAASKNANRNEQGYFEIKADLHDEAKAALQNLGNKYPAFKGYYPDPKPFIFSDIVTQLNLLGIYFPFSIEANYNNNLYDLDMPSTMCHELSHLKGWMQEDEANFISFLACTNSDNKDFIYSGYADALEYFRIKLSDDENISNQQYAEFVNNIDVDIIKDINESHKIFRKAKETKVGTVMADVSDAAIEVSLKINGVHDGAKSYGRFVDLLLNYYLDDDGNIIEH